MNSTNLNLIFVVIIFLILKIYELIINISLSFTKKIHFQKNVKDFFIFLYISHPLQSPPFPSSLNSQTNP